MATVTFLPQNLTVDVPEGTSLLAAEIRAGLRPDAPCGGNGRCGKCAVKIADGGVYSTVLACRTAVTGDMTVETVISEEETILSTGLSRAVKPEPAVSRRTIKVDRPSLDDLSSDWERLARAIKRDFGVVSVAVNLDIAKNLRDILTVTDYSPEAIMCGERLIALRPAGGRFLLAAADIGTTTVVAYLMDGESGALLGTLSGPNPQRQYGADVISRANYALENGSQELTDCIRGAVNELISRLCHDAGAGKSDVFALTVAGNTCMHHLFLGIDTKSLVLAPYVPAVSEALTLSAPDCSIEINPGGLIFALPCVAGFVGADTAAVMLSLDFDRLEELTLAIDVGTNGEIVLGDKRGYIACSTAAGPAFEGAGISCGMRGASGAIDHVFAKDGELSFTVLGGGEAAGICGSGLMDLTAVLRRAGIIDESGRFADEDETADGWKSLYDKVRTYEGQKAFFITEGVFLTQKDVRQVQLAKAAMAAGVRILLRELDKEAEDINKVVIAGAFGSYMDPDSACDIGLISPALRGRVSIIGNAAGEGARIAAINGFELSRASEIAGKAEFLELAGRRDFQDVFVEELEFPEL